jgi:hypothetical protein
MKKHLLLLLAVGLCLSPLAARAAAKSDSAATTVPGAEKLAQTVSMITGVAISPLLGVSGVGCWQYVTAKTEAEKASLPWYAHPMFWAPSMLLVLACFVKDTAGAALPTAVKKPLDVAETVEHKISGLVATGAFVPIAASVFHATGGSSALLGSLGFAGVDLSWLYNALMVPVSMAAFAIVFLASNAINILILLSPFTTVDAALKGFRAAILASVAGTALMNPWIGLAWALVVILISYLIAGWSFRLSHFGLVFVWDFFTLRKKRFTPAAAANKMFLSRKINRVPARTYGKLSLNEQGRLVLTYRPWLILPARPLVLPEGKYCVGEGAFFSEIHRLEGDDTRDVLLLPPRYRTHEEQLVRIYQLEGVRPIGLLAAWAWVKGLFGGKSQPLAA